MEFTIAELKEATMDFSADNIIGEGGFGTNHQGTVRKCLDVATKVLSKVFLIVDNITCSRINCYLCNG